MSVAQRLAAGVAKLGLDLDERTQERLLAYGALLTKWNKVYNLTAIRDEAGLIDLHLLDSLTMLPWVKDFSAIADVGTGGGLPGIPLAICRPGMAVTLVETVGKKASFLQQAKAELGLENVTVHNCRVEQLQPSLPFPAVISRAFSSLRDFTALTGQLLAPEGVWLAMKGVYPDDELAALPSSIELRAVHRLEVPAVAAERHLLILSRN
ncbi:MAG: 16S rRNA (guanine(527)-N(7))-methyltransferase RsmG [Candidatus Dactylopiibacterium carminicum]|uniref:Ribosomal RNA small subunit methyltransferase G n=1 Tax=Candidatus Dactylopiibacterium carminicum TaxID=857335 RepID=A0A272ES25_9RHOO|nr:16S rRNA (guanine(527)-N(7))-methyltransferase RsmG [Candidatus Dactylopiibacterium carminicum]KAF7598928.1 16S rRNA (guanine(527)-N(7))-methyltransferase RsmG [Candidatus Dactylopiibacterium carminicum]PAS92904.1 MAG: 16S rRNA (guanine(527)-N(7))-methyltransferase RsmG [Candidatus Dactylopiibacterium carminicum]PAS96483.1 MAG: 16S rRNA (guanine(527)-N(7))-methyltransferase RsmG [Candidatus Dactylopiibacterium carminicum]PAS98944.1 MAG: 16S rRNA (guanine(527)-N(7))-methyltransferase RsmG [Ca